MSEKISIILPVYNEKESLLIMVRLLNSSLKISSEIIIVHDNHTDNSLESAKILKNEFDNVKIDNKSSERIDQFIDKHNSNEYKFNNKVNFKNFVNNFFSNYAG